MELDKFKICPSCGEHNPPALFECKNCEADLMSVKITDRASLIQAEPESNASEEVTQNIAQNMVRICDCGAKNASRARKCEACGEDISDVIAVNTLLQQPEFLIKPLDKDEGFPISEPVVILGRGASMNEYLSAKAYVSRRHAKLTITGQELFIEDLGSSNSTFINNEIIPKGVPVKLSDGDEIALGGKLIGGQRQEQAAYFIFNKRL